MVVCAGYAIKEACICCKEEYFPYSMFMNAYAKGHGNTECGRLLRIAMGRTET
jgi:hypothetical protein